METLLCDVLPLHLGNCLPSTVVTVAMIPLHFFLLSEKQHVNKVLILYAKDVTQGELRFSKIQ